LHVLGPDHRPAHGPDFAIDWNQSVAAGVVLVGWVLRITLDIEAAHGDLPEA